MCTKVLILTLLLASPLWAQVDVESVPAPETNPVSLNINSYGGLQFTNKIKIPKGRRGLQPDLALSYMSGQQNGVAGLNWSLPVLSVDLKDGYQTRYFVGGTELVWDSSSNAYSKKLSDFSTYVFDGASWTCVTREGLVMVFGGTADSRLSNSAGKVARWFVSRVTDSNGNYISYEYQNYGQPLIKTIRYTGHPNLAPYYAIHFHYENRPDAVQSVETGFLTVLSVRLKTIQVVAGTQNVRAYSLKYTQSPYTKRSLLQSVTEFGSDVKVATNGNCTGSSLPAVIYSYRDQKQNLVNHIKSTGGLPGHDFKSARDTLFAYTDRSGVGMAAATRRDSGWVTIYKGNEAGLTPVLISRQGIAGYSFLGEMDVLAHVPGAVHDYFIAFRLGEDRFWLIRHNPDGSYTATHQSETGIGSFSPGQKHKIATFLDREGSHIIFWGEKSYAHIMIDEESEQLELIDRSSSVAGITPSENHVLSAVDLDSDGFTDLLAVNTKTNKTVVMLSHGGGAYESVPFSAGTFKGVLFNKLLGVGHFNQDNRPDVLLHDGGTSYYVASLVDRRLTVMAVGTLPEATPTAGRMQADVGEPVEWCPNYYDKAALADVNGDGITDIVWRSSVSGESLLYRGEGEFHFNEVSYYPYGGYFRYGREIVLPIDFRGNGCQGIVSVLPDTGWATLVSFYDQAPDLLVRSESGAGESSTVVYTPSSKTSHRLMPVMQLVKEHSVYPGYGPAIRTQFEHHGGFYDTRAGEFLGFSEVKETAANGRWRLTKFHQKEYLKGMPFVQELGFGASVHKRTETEYLETGAASRFVGVERVTTTLFEDQSFAHEDFQYDLRNGMVSSHSVHGTNGTEILNDSKAYGRFGHGWRCVESSRSGSFTGLKRKELYKYDPNGNLLEMTQFNEPSNLTASYGVDQFGNEIWVTNPRGFVTKQTYDAKTATHVVLLERPQTSNARHISKLSIDLRFGKANTAFDENGSPTDIQLDVFGRETQWDYPDGGRKIIRYVDLFPRTVTVSVLETLNPESWVTAGAYFDGLGRPIQTFKRSPGNYIITQSFYDEMGRNWRNIGPFFSGSSAFPQTAPVNCLFAEIEFDVFDRVTARVSPAEFGFARVGFQHSGLTNVATDADGVATARTKDFRDRVVVINEQGSPPLALKWDAADQLIDVRYGDQSTTIDYSPAGEKIALTDSVVGNWQWRYTSGLMTSQVDARRVEVRLTYDQLGRVLRKEYQNGETPVTTIYDLGANGIGHPYSVTKGGFSTIYPGRDELGRELAVKQKIPGSPQYEYITSMEYNAAGALLRLVYPDAYWVQYNLHPGTGLLNAVVDPQGVVAEFGDYTPAGKIEYVLFRNGVSHEYLHHPMTTQLSEIQVVDPEGKILWNRQLGYSAAGDVVRSTLEADGLKSAEVYSLLAHRLQLPGAAVAYQGGRPQRVTVDGQSYGLTTDPNGNILESPVFGEKVKKRKVTFNVDNKPIRIEVSDPASPPNTATVNLEYDAVGKLAVLRSNARETFFISPHFEIQNGVATRYLFAGRLRIAMIQGNEMKFMHQDHLGSVVLMTNGYGRPTERQAFQPFGQAGRDAAARFQDKEWEKTTQLYLHGARLYDPVLRIFISADSMVQDPFDPAAYERYLFARGNPLVFTDPSGHWFLVDDILIGAAIGALIGGSFSAITGGDILQGAIVGGISGAFFGAAGGLIEAAGGAAVPLAHQVGAHVVAGMFSGGIGAGAFGGNPGMGMLIGGLGAGAGKFASMSVPSAWGMPGKLAAASLSGGLMGGTVSAMGGGSFGHGFALGAAQATYGYFCNFALHHFMADFEKIIYGVKVGITEGIKGGSYSIEEGGKATWGIATEGPPLAKFGLAVAAVSLSPLAIEGAKWGYQVVLYQAMTNPQGVVDFLNSMMPGIPAPSNAGLFGYSSGRILTLLGAGPDNW